MGKVNFTIWRYPSRFLWNFVKWSENRNLQQSDWWHQEASDLWDETLYKRAFRVPKSVEEWIVDAEQRELITKAIAALPEIQRRRFLLCHKYDFNYRQIGEMEHCRPKSIMHSVIRAREKLKALIEKYRAGQ